MSFVATRTARVGALAAVQLAVLAVGCTSVTLAAAILTAVDIAAVRAALPGRAARPAALALALTGMASATILGTLAVQRLQHPVGCDQWVLLGIAGALGIAGHPSERPLSTLANVCVVIAAGAAAVGLLEVDAALGLAICLGVLFSAWRRWIAVGMSTLPPQ